MGLTSLVDESMVRPPDLNWNISQSYIGVRAHYIMLRRGCGAVLGRQGGETSKVQREKPTIEAVLS